MGIKFERQKGKYKIMLMAMLLAGSCFLTYYFHEILEIGTFFTHLFYIPIILASLWWKRKGVVVAIFLAVFLSLSHHFFRDHVLTGNDYLRALMFVVISFVVAILSEMLAKSQENTAHLNAILQAIRNVDQLISTEKDRGKLLKGACENLIETQGFHNAWIALSDETGGLVTPAEAGLGKDFLPMVERLKSGGLTACGQKAMSQSMVLVTKDPYSTCTDCPLSDMYSGRGAMTVRLEYEGKVYGLLSVSIPRVFISDEEEQRLFKQVADDLAFGLHRLELEEERKRAEEEIQEYAHDLGKRVKELNCLYGISRLLEKRNVSLEEILQGTIDLIPPAWQYPEIACARLILNDRIFRTKNFKETIWEQAGDITVHNDRIGTLKVCYLEERPESDEGPFLREERSLINAIGERVGKIIEQVRAEEELRKYRNHLEDLVKERTAELTMANQGLQREIAERKRAEDALKESKEKYHSMMEAMNDPVYICSPDYRVTYMNPAMVKRTGSNARGEPCYKLIHERNEKCPWCIHDKIQQGEPSQTELVSPKDGRFYHVSHSPIFHTDGSISKMTILRDLTRLKQTQEALQENEERYRTLTEQVAEGVTLVQEGKLLFANHAFSSMFGYEAPKQLIGRKIVDLISDALDQGIKEIYRSLESGISGEKTFRAACHKQDGREFWVEGHHVVIKWKGKPALITAVRDITEKRLKEIVIQEESENLRKENLRLRSSIKERYRLGNIIGKSPAIQEVYELILMATASNASVVVYGESGTGKELVAQAIHEMSHRSDKPFVVVNCGAIPHTLIESELFGYKKGAFTGADRDKHGYLDLAEGGTLFLDEVGELDLNMQVKLLRAIDGGGYAPVGSNRNKKSDFRIVAATNRDLMNQVSQGLMREDFFYRIHVVPITVPPLKNRKEDIPLLVDHFLKVHGNGKNRQALPGKVLASLHDYDWPGNVRELQNALHRYLTVKRLDFISTHTPQAADERSASTQGFHLEGRGLRGTIEGLEKESISKVLEQNHWHRAKTAKMLGISERTLYRKLKQFQSTLS